MWPVNEKVGMEMYQQKTESEYFVYWMFLTQNFEIQKSKNQVWKIHDSIDLILL